MWPVTWEPLLVVQVHGLGHQEPRTGEGPALGRGS